jgi:autotransporter-associated beta strand protein
MNSHLHNRLIIGFLLLCCEFFSLPIARSQSATWTGGGASADWSQAGNWTPLGQPPNGSTLDFAGDAVTTSTNDIAGGAFAGLSFTNDGSNGRTGQFLISGSSITLDGNIVTAATSSGTLSDTLGIGLALSGTREISTGTNHGLTITGAISGDGYGLIKNGPGSLTLTNSNTFTGPLTVDTGLVILSNSSTANSWPSTVINAGTLRAFGRESVGGANSMTTVNSSTLDLRNFNAALDRNIVFNGTSRLTLALSQSGIFRIGSLVMPSSGTLTISSQVNSGTATMTHTLGTTLALTGDGSLFLEPINSSGSLTTLKLTGGITDTGTNLVRKISTGVLLLESDVRNRGETRLSNGFVRLGKNEALASGAGFGNLTMNPINSALLQLNGFSQTLNGISNSGSGRSILANDSDANGTLTVGANDADGTFSGEIRDVSRFSGDFTGTLSLVKTGTGSLTLSGPLSMNYTGSTSVQGGTLAILTSQASTAGAVRVAASGTLLGSGTVGQLEIDAGGTVAPGAGLGTLTTTQGVTWASGASYNWQITDAAGAAGTGWDLLSVGGGLAIGSTAAEPIAINLWSLSQVSPLTDGPASNFDPSLSYAWTIASITGGISGFAADKFLVRTAAANGTSGFANSVGSGTFTVAQEGNDLQVVFTPGTPSSDIVIDVPSGSQTQAQAGYPTIGSATSVTKTGTGTLVMDVANSYTGPTTVSAGTLEVAAADALGATNVTVDAGSTLVIASSTTMKSPGVIIDGGTLAGSTVAVNGSAGIASLAINSGTITGAPTVRITAGGQMSLVQNARVTVGVGGLELDQATGGGRLDVGAGQLTIAPGGITAADLRADIIAGRASGAWNGATGIMSSTAAAAGGNRAVGYVVAGDGSARVSFAAPGDVDLNGQVNVFDLVSINSSGRYGTGSASVWNTGDFNYDGVTNVFDLVGINTAAVYGQGNYFPAAPTAAGLGSVAAVPEPATWLFAAFGAGGLAATRVLRAISTGGRRPRREKN